MSGAKLAKSTPEELNTLFSHSDFFIDLHHVDTIAEAFELRAKYTPDTLNELESDVHGPFLTNAINKSMGVMQSLIYKHPSINDLAQKLVQIHENGLSVPTVPLKVDAVK
ncbi:hypothetical protein BZG36_05725, partial [Bifiguratus adelaidae]